MSYVYIDMSIHTYTFYIYITNANTHILSGIRVIRRLETCQIYTYIQKCFSRYIQKCFSFSSPLFFCLGNNTYLHWKHWVQFWCVLTGICVAGGIRVSVLRCVLQCVAVCAAVCLLEDCQQLSIHGGTRKLRCKRECCRVRVWGHEWGCEWARECVSELGNARVSAGMREWAREETWCRRHEEWVGGRIVSSFVIWGAYD